MYFFSILLFVSSILMAKHDLNSLAIKSNADKGPRWHNYTPVYEHYFNPLRNEPIKLLEIGFAGGLSALLWDSYFTKAAIYFIDIDHNTLNTMRSLPLSNRCHLHIVNQENRDDLLAYIGKVGGDFDIIIDDGGHSMNQQITSFEVLFPFVKSGGIYIIEDLHTSYRSEWGGIEKVTPYDSSYRTTVNFLKNLIDDVNYIGQKTFCADKKKSSPEAWEAASYLQKNIKSMHFYSSLVVIIKE